MKKIIMMLVLMAFPLFGQQGISVITYPMLFDSATTTSTISLQDFRTQGYRFAGIQFDSSNISTSYELKVSSDNVDFGSLVDIDNVAIGVFTTTANSEKVHAVTLWDFLPFNYAYFESDSTEQCTIKAILWKEE